MLQPDDMLTMMDGVRRQAGLLADLCGCGPIEAPWRIVLALPASRLRAYQPADAPRGPVLLIIPAPIKRPYVWDLLPTVSVVRACLRRGIRVFLLEWLPPAAEECRLGLGDYALRIPAAAAEAVVEEAQWPKLAVAGHSLGGTFAAIFAAACPDMVSRLVLVDAPLAFGRHGGPLASTLMRMPRSQRDIDTAAGCIPGSAIGVLASLAVPEEMVWARWADLCASFASPQALAIHLRMERWALDELPLAGRMVQDVVDDLYRDDRLCRGSLTLGGAVSAGARLQVPVLGVADRRGRVVPAASLVEGLRALCSRPPCLLYHAPQIGPMLRHLGPLVSHDAHRRLWPQILSWLGGAP